jgi:hypothetical protein
MVRVRALLVAAVACGCQSVTYQGPPVLAAPAGEAIARVEISERCLYLLGLGVYECDDEPTVRARLGEAARRIGADRVIDVRVEATPASGIWWLLTRFLPAPPRVHASGVAVRERAPLSPAPAASPAPSVAPTPAASPDPPAPAPDGSP